MTTDELLEAVVKWGQDHNLHDPVMQFAKMNEEVGEIAHELTRGRVHTSEMEDALGDTMVTLVILADILGYDIIKCLEVAYNQIKDRHGKTIAGSFVKEEE